MTRTKMMIAVGSLALIAGGLLSGGCDQSASTGSAGGGGGPQPPAGSTATVQFRRDYLGGAKDGPASATAGEINGAQVGLSGKLLRVTDEWVVLEAQGREQWVPKSAILYLDVTTPQ